MPLTPPPPCYATGISPVTRISRGWGDFQAPQINENMLYYPKKCGFSQPKTWLTTTNPIVQGMLTSYLNAWKIQYIVFFAEKILKCAAFYFS